ncbi:MAG: tRNA uridine-5-carboxymethylaminomethyl(34) synthesis GTPase MnmE [Bacteroidales bacterium]|nr:tRNA uridine-5-carboxymethylaminomethyl(34) synthesis GTPase MnmE [Bacteroidales bacterium]
MIKKVNFEDTTICACATGNNISAISVIRISGPDDISIVAKIFKPKKDIPLSEVPGYTVLYGIIPKRNGVRLDDVIVTFYRAPHSYTGEDSAEISCHGSPYIVSEIISMLIDNGAVYAQGGDFTKRAFLNGKMDLVQAEAVGDLILSETEAAHDVAMRQMRGAFSKELSQMREKLLKIVSLLELELDFSEEEVEFTDRKELRELLENSCEHINELISSFKVGNAIKNGVPVAIVGSTNTGKSTLLNALVGEDRAIVSPHAGTTRDTIEDVINLEGVLFRFIDTAGIRSTLEAIEIIGIERTFYKIKQAQIVLLMLDGTRKEEFKESLNALSRKINSEEQTLIILINKCDQHAILPASETDDAVIGNIESIFNATDLIEEVRTLSSVINLYPSAILPISARQGLGLDALRSTLVESQKNMQSAGEMVLVNNMRHYSALKDAFNALLRANIALGEQVPTDLVAQDIREALYSIGTIVGEISTDEVLGNIFKNFCIGK